MFHLLFLEREVNRLLIPRDKVQQLYLNIAQTSDKGTHYSAYKSTSSTEGEKRLYYVPPISHSLIFFSASPNHAIIVYRHRLFSPRSHDSPICPAQSDVKISS